MFNWCLSRGLIDASPCAGVAAPVKENSRDRVLTDEEVRLFWKATGVIGYPFGPLFRLLLLTGARLREAGHATWSELDLEAAIWVLPAARSKNAKPHEWHLSPPALELIEALPRLGAPARYVFTTSG